MGEHKTLFRIRMRFFGQEFGVTSSFGLKHVLTTVHTMFGVVEKANYIFIGQSLHLFI